MTLQIDRRRLVLGGALGVGALLLPAGRSLAADVLGARGFTHSVASGEPGPDSMLLWTRHVPAAGGDEVRLDAEVALDPGFAKVVSGAAVRTGAWRDWTAKATVEGLEPGTVYWFRFVAPDGSKSPVGRTKTLPAGDARRFGLALFSCSNMPVGWFNAYAHAAARDDLDLWLHVGDYVYEYGLDHVAVADQVAGRDLMPAHEHEMISLADYRMRLACYRADPDLQKLHQTAPMVALWDDHETANDCWEGGAQNHQPDAEGDWGARRAAAVQAYREWMPVSDEPWKAYPLGSLATLYRTESRLFGRTRQADDALAAVFKAGTDSAIEAFRDGPWRDPSATMLGLEQESWLAHALQERARSTHWQLVGMGTILGRTVMPPETVGWLHPGTSESRAQFFRDAVRAGRLGMPMWMDRWDGYPAARSRLLAAAQRADADLVMLSGDSHNAWAFSLSEDGQPAGVEIAGQAVTSGGIEASLGADPKDVAKAFVSANPEIAWCDTSRRGYVMLDITAERVTGEWVFVKDIKSRGADAADTHRMSVDRGRRKFVV